MVLMQSRAMPIVRIGRPTLPAQAQMQLQLCRQLQEGQCPSVVSQRISWLQVSYPFKCLPNGQPHYVHKACFWDLQISRQISRQSN